MFSCSPRWLCYEVCFKWTVHIVITSSMSAFESWYLLFDYVWYLTTNDGSNLGPTCQSSTCATWLRSHPVHDRPVVPTRTIRRSPIVPIAPPTVSPEDAQCVPRLVSGAVTTKMVVWASHVPMDWAIYVRIVAGIECAPTWHDECFVFSLSRARPVSWMFFFSHFSNCVCYGIVWQIPIWCENETKGQINGFDRRSSGVCKAQDGPKGSEALMAPSGLLQNSASESDSRAISDQVEKSRWVGHVVSLSLLNNLVNLVGVDWRQPVLKDCINGTTMLWDDSKEICSGSLSFSQSGTVPKCAALTQVGSIVEQTA